MAMVIAMLIAFGGSYFAHIQARKFVRSRLRFVDAAHKRRTPFIAGLVAGLLVLPIGWLFPLISLGTAIAIGIGVGTGVAAGSREVRLAVYRVD
jgi:hypothetical protein